MEQQSAYLGQDPADHGPIGPDSIAILQIVLNQMTVMEHRITQRMDVQAEAAKNRWKSHDEQHDEYDQALKGLIKRFDELDHVKELEERAFNARVQPIQKVGYWFFQNWKSIVLFMLAIFGLITSLGDWIVHAFDTLTLGS